jgi:hypothetical protein
MAIPARNPLWRCFIEQMSQLAGGRGRCSNEARLQMLRWHARKGLIQVCALQWRCCHLNGRIAVPGSRSRGHQARRPRRPCPRHPQEPGLLQKALISAAARGDAQLLRGILHIFKEKRWQPHLGPVIEAR